MDPETFRRHGHRLVDWVSAYLNGTERYPVLSCAKPGAIRDALPTSPPQEHLAKECRRKEPRI